MEIFVLLSRFPYPLEKGDKLRAFYQIKELSKTHSIHLCALSDKKVNQSSIDKLLPYCSSIDVIQISKIQIYYNILKGLIFSKLPLQVSYFFNKSAKSQIFSLVKKYQIDHIYAQLIRTAEYVKDIDNVPKTLDYMDALSRGMERRIENSSFYLRPFVRLEAYRLKRYEHFIFSYFNKTTIISEQDKELIVNANNDLIQIIPNGVQHDFFKSKKSEKKYDLIFTGNMSYEPNVLSAEYLVREIIPLIKKQLPLIQVAIVGASPSSRVKALANKSVLVTGWVDDIRTYYNAARIFIAPMQIGTGLQNKLLEAMAMELPCITSELANNALGAIEGESILIGRSPEEYANFVVHLLHNEEERNRLAIDGNDYVKKQYSWETSTKKLAETFITE
ncbi:glycosyltransferase [Vicingaceae bacterium]|nr:glycosyltransferase [Vicingaceae bacterium]